MMVYLGIAAAWLATNCWWGTVPGTVELAENGVIEQGTRFLPYARFQSVRWNHYFPDVLVLSLRHRAVQVIVPAGHRERLERFLTGRNLVSA